jgi:hypothetical protein
MLVALTSLQLGYVEPLPLFDPRNPRNPRSLLISPVSSVPQW